MKPRHAAALALVGWYLMTPPLIGPNYAIKEDAPFSQWVIAQTFDTASDCEREKAAQKAKILPSAGTRGALPYCRDCFLECIATDDPRLKETK